VIQTFRILMSNPKRLQVLENCLVEIRRMAANGDVEVTLGDVIRTLSQNAKLWPMLADIAAQVPWMHTVGGNWQSGLMATDDWKDVLTAAYRKETRMAHGVDGGMVMLGCKTSTMGKKDFAQFIEFLYAFGSLRGVTWSERAESDYQQYRPRLAA
jgi:hypothetical protein